MDHETEIPDLSDLLDRVPGWGRRARVERALEGGITNRNYLVAVDGSRFVLRVAGHDTHLLEIDRRVEREANARAASIGIAPEVVAFIEPEGYLVTRFVEGAPIPEESLASPEVLRPLADALRSFHASGPLTGDFDCFRIPAMHRAVAVSRGVPIPADYDRAADLARGIEAAFAASPEPRVPCHNDLLNANFLARNGRIWILDWEYAGNNDRYFDLANLATNNCLDDAAREALLEAYFGSVTPRRRARLALMTLMSDFREAMWGVVQQGLSTLDFDYRAYSAKHFDRLVANAADPAHEHHLAEAALPEAAADASPDRP